MYSHEFSIYLLINVPILAHNCPLAINLSDPRQSRRRRDKAKARPHEDHYMQLYYVRDTNFHIWIGWVLAPLLDIYV